MTPEMTGLWVLWLAIVPMCNHEVGEQQVMAGLYETYIHGCETAERAIKAGALGFHHVRCEYHSAPVKAPVEVETVPIPAPNPKR